MTKILTLIAATLFGFAAPAIAQVEEVSQADQKFSDYAFIDAISIYEKVAQQGYRSAEIFQRLGDAYYFNGRYEEAAKWYKELMAENPTPSSEYLYRYAQSLKSTGDYKQADALMQRFATQNEQDNRGRLYVDKEDYLEVIREHSGRYELSDAGVNTEFSEYGPAWMGSSLVFTSTREGAGTRIDKWSNQAFSHLYKGAIGMDNRVSDASLFSEDVGSDYHESTAVFTKDGTTMYFTRNNQPRGKVKKGESRILKLKLFRAVFDGKKWDNIQELPFNSEAYSCAHPALSPDEKTLYFVSDMPGSVGMSDLYRVAIAPDGTFGTPENLGTGINTESRETFPFISAGNELYFSSDGHPGLGGLDVFRVIIDKNGGYSQPVNVGGPVNGSDDDFSYIINPATKKGFFASNRNGAQASDDIYSFIELKTLSDDAGQHRPIAGVVTDPETGTPVEGARITIYDGSYNKLGETVTGKDGKYDLGDLGYGDYRLKIEKPGYETREIVTEITRTDPQGDLSNDLNRQEKEVKAGDDIAGILKIRDIYFDLNRWVIRADAGVNLAKVLVFMKDYPQVKIEVRSHTDSRGDATYNQQLSEKRAQSTIAWLIKNGIDPSRLKAIGYGESRPVNHCRDGVSCSEAEHQHNRRSEFIISWEGK